MNSSYMLCNYVIIYFLRASFNYTRITYKGRNSSSEILLLVVFGTIQRDVKYVRGLNFNSEYVPNHLKEIPRKILAK